MHQAGDIITQRYQITDILGQGGVGITYAAKDLKTTEEVAIKGLSLHHLNDWKILQLFEREAKTLAQLNHPAIARYIDYFEIDMPENRSFYIVQQRAPGKSFAELVAAGWRTNEREVRKIAAQVLDILIYLQNLTPPVFHRDIKPQNLIYDKQQVYLVDFGAVTNTYQNTVARGSTVVGTFGYMAPEQFSGQTVAATDLYGLGATLLFLLSHRSPAELPQERLKINFRTRVQVSEHFATWLEKMLEPDMEQRFSSENIICSDDGKIFLVDFGAVQDVYHNTVTGSSTVVGTYGYMAPEQFRGQAVLATDLYGLGTTLIYLLTRKLPSDLPQRNLRINFQSSANVKVKFAKWLKRMIEPVAEDRFASASEALAVLQDEQSLKSAANTIKPNFLTQSHLDYFNDGDGLVLKINPVFFRTKESQLLALFAVLFFGLSYWLTLIISAPNYSTTPPILWMFPLLFGALSIWQLLFFIKLATSRIHLEIERDKFCLQQWLLGRRYRYVRGNTFDMSKFLIEPAEISFATTADGEFNTVCTFRVKRQKYSFGWLLSPAEKKWIVAEVNDFLQD